MTGTGIEACEAIRAHHQALGDGLTERATAVTTAAAAGQPHDSAVASLIAYLAEEVLPHAAAEEKTIYPAVVARTGLGDVVGEMTAEHAILSASAGRLAVAANGATAAEEARRIAELFTAHAARENDVLLPALLADQTADLAGLLSQMHHALERTARTAQDGDDDPQAAVLTLLLQATGALARGGDADRACRLAAAAWAALRETRPDLAGKVTTALHGLARKVDGAAPDGSPGDACGCAAGDPDLDVRDLPPAQRHEAIFSAYFELAPGAGFVLVNDHDPKPLRYQFEAEHAGQFTWDYLESGPRAWRVRIGRAVG